MRIRAKTMIQLFNKLIKRYLKYRYPRIVQFKEQPHKAQERVLKKILSNNTDCSYCSKYGVTNTIKTFKSNTPLVEYEDIRSYISSMMLGEANVLVPGKVKWFSKSAGTTEGKSKYIPVTADYLIDGHYKGSWDNVTTIYHNDPNSRIFELKNLLMGGSIAPFDKNPAVQVGDISGIIIHNMPAVGRPFYTPDFQTAVLEDWNEKIDTMTQRCSKDRVFTIAGVPTWTTVLFDSILDFTGKATMREVWPDASYYMHGGVNFDPYRSRFAEYFPENKMRYINMYNASEGYFALQDLPDDDSMLLLLDNDVYYEFIPLEDYHSSNRTILELQDVELDQDYVLVITTSAGLWRYVMGDVIKFTSLSPYRIQISGRTQQYINVFGEEVMVHNTDKALEKTCEVLDCSIVDYTVAPIYMEKSKLGGHEWLIEFHKKPKNIQAFVNLLDNTLRAINSDYDAKRTDDLALGQLKLGIAKTGLFSHWLQTKNKYGGQSKIPRLQNDRNFLESLLVFNQDV